MPDSHTRVVPLYNSTGFALLDCFIILLQVMSPINFRFPSAVLMLIGPVNGAMIKCDGTRAHPRVSDG